MKFVELSVLIRYDTKRAYGYKQVDSQKETIVRLRQHLTALRMPHPKPENVQRIAEDVIRFWWTTQDDSPHFQHVSRAVLAQDKAVMKNLLMKSIEISVKPTDPPAAPLLLPAFSRRNSFSNSAPTEPKFDPTNLQDKAQLFLDGLNLAPGPAPLASRAASVLSSICSSRNYSPPTIKHEVAELVACDPMEVLEQTSLGVVVPDPRPSTPESDDMVLSPIPGFATLPTCDPMIIDDHPGPHDTHKDNDRLIVHQLSMGLLDIRKEVASDLIKADAILQALKTMDAPDIPEPSPELSSGEKDFVAKVRLQLLQTELEHARLRRRAVEDSIKEITRECRPPFVCPALMDAFVAVSQLTTQALAAEN